MHYEIHIKIGNKTFSGQVELKDKLMFMEKH